MRNKPAFLKDENDHHHFSALSALVKSYLEQNSNRDRQVILWKAAILPLLYILFYIFAIKNSDSLLLLLVSYSFMGISGVFIFLNLIHEATHGLLFKKKKWNRIYLYVFDLIGLNSFIWMQRHIRLHHNFPNLMGWDGDIEQSGLFQIFPQGKPTPQNRWQHLYIFIFYPLYLFNWIYIRDFNDFFKQNRAVRTLVAIPGVEFFKLFLFKGIYIVYMFIIPITLGAPFWWVLLAGFCETIAGSIFALIVLLPPHANTGNHFPVPRDGNQLETNWFRHQLITTNDVLINNWWSRNCMANFNYHVIHHLFPSVSYTHAPALTNILRNYALEHDLPYRAVSLWQSLYQHYLLVKQNAIRASAIFSEDM